jgi:hypothetical protein
MRPTRRAARPLCFVISPLAARGERRRRKAGITGASPCRLAPPTAVGGISGVFHSVSAVRWDSRPSLVMVVNHTRRNTLGLTSVVEIPAQRLILLVGSICSFPRSIERDSATIESASLIDNLKAISDSIPRTATRTIKPIGETEWLMLHSKATPLSWLVMK